MLPVIGRVPAGVADLPRHHRAGCSPTAASTGSPPTRSAACDLAAGLAVDRHPAEPLHRLRGRRRRGQGVHRGAPRHPRRGRVRGATSAPASSPRPSSTRRWTCWPWRARPVSSRAAPSCRTTATRAPLTGACGSLCACAGVRAGDPISTSCVAWEWPQAAHGRAVALLDVLQAPLDLGGRVGLPVGAGAGHLGARQRLRDAVGARGAVAGRRSSTRSPSSTASRGSRTGPRPSRSRRA